MDRKQLSALTVAQLRDLAAAHGIANTKKLRKVDLVDAIADALAATPPAGAVIPPRGQAPAPAARPAGSSSVIPAPPAPPQKGPDPGLPIPDRYGRDRLVLMVQDPWHVFAYWEITPESLARLRGTVGDGPIVLVLHTPNGREQREVDLAGGNYYLSLAPDADYRAELALRDAKGHLHILAVSNSVRTPPAAPSDRADEAWMAVDETFHELLDRAGLPGAAGSSAALSSAALARRIVAWNLTHVDQRALFSGLLQQAPSSLSSHTLTRR